MKTAENFAAITAPTQFVNVNGINFAYRRFGNKTGFPLVHLQHFTGTMENWDPKVLDNLAKDREVIIFDNKGVAGTNGKTPDTIFEIAKDTIAFIDALELTKINLLGFSMGGMVAQQVTLYRPDLINKLILIGTAPRGGHDIEDFSPEVWAMFAKEYELPYGLLLETLFTSSPESQKAGHAFLSRIQERVVDRDTEISEFVAPAQSAAITDWARTNPGEFDYLKDIKVPVFILTGDNDIIFPSVNSSILKDNLPDAQLIVYPNANHGAQYQYPELFVKQLNLFLEGVK